MKVHVPSSRKPRIEMLPLIDVVFLLLVFFIFAMLSMAVHRGMPVDLPVSTSVDVEKRLTLSVSIDRSGRIFLDKHPVSLMELTAAIQAQKAVHPTSGILIFADNQLTYQDLFRVIDRIKAAGISRISLQAEIEVD